MNEQVRQQRVRNGSRRKRDLEATTFDFESFVAKNFPDELPHRARHASERVWIATGKRPPKPDEVRWQMEQLGTTKAQLEAKYGVGVQ